MAQTYLENRIAEALKKAKGNQTKARQIVTNMALEDDQLLLAITRPHLPALVAHAVGHFAAGLKSKKKTDADDLPPIPKAAKGQGGFGLDLLKALGGPNTPKFGREEAAPPVKKKKASEQHVSALKLLASKSKSKPR